MIMHAMLSALQRALERGDRKAILDLPNPLTRENRPASPGSGR